MFQKGSFSIPSDSSGIYLIKVIQTYRCGTRRHAIITKFLRVVLRVTRPILIKKRKKRVKALVIRTQVYSKKNTGVTYNFFDNGAVLLKRRLNTLGKELKGPTSTALRIKKFRLAFRSIF